MSAMYRRLRALIHDSAAELIKFGAVGGVAFLTDLGLFQLLCHTWQGSPTFAKPITSRVISVIIATTVSYIGNRYWTWRHRATENLRREYLLFFIVNGAAMVLGVIFLGFSNYVLHLHGAGPDFVANVTGVVAGTAFRYWAYKRYVFTNT
ncbi:MAG: GtrA family protein [Actinobacteria bacterium]|jgi:hypothetical protein|nr:GtrA family protein [Actinomycetota bacterium]